MRELLRCCAWAAAAFLAALPALADSQSGPPAVHPALAPVLAEPQQPLSPRLAGPMGGFQGSLDLDGQKALDLVLRTTASREDLEAQSGLEVRSLRAGVATVTVLPGDLKALVARGDVQAITLPQTYRYHLEETHDRTGVRPLRSESGGIFSGRTGAGVVVGVIDSGIDFDHPDFVDAAGNRRIAYLWDQTVNTPSRAPAPWAYGTEWEAGDLYAGVATEVDSLASGGHGTHVTGLAAGDGSAPDASGTSFTYTGMAPEATIIFVKPLNLGDTAVIDGLEYIFDRADSLGMPAVINLSFGGQIGSHDGTAPLEQQIDSLVTAQPGRAVVTSAGNDRADGIHAQIETLPSASVIGPDFAIDGTYTPLGGAGNDFLILAGYYDSTDDLTVHMGTPAGNHYSQPLNTSASSNGCQIWSGSDGTVEICNNFRSNLGMGTGDREIAITLWDGFATSPPAGGTWSLALTGNTVTGAGIVDFWMFSSLGGEFNKAAFSSHVEELGTVSMPATGREVIAVGAYASKLCWTDHTGAPWSYSGAPVMDDIAPFSSAGPSRDGRLKPEVAAPGFGTISALADEVRGGLIGAGLGAFVINDHYRLNQGTSQASPLVTGAVALLFEEDPSYTVSDIRDLLRKGARRDAFTALYEQPLIFSGSPAPYLPGATINYSFGHGKLDLGRWAWDDEYESNDRLETARGLISGQRVSALLEHGADVDYFLLADLESGDHLDVALSSLPGDYRLRLSQSTPFGTCGLVRDTFRATSDEGGTADEAISFSLTSAATPRHLRVDSAGGAFDPADDYELRAVLTRPETLAFHGSAATAQELPLFKELRVTGLLTMLTERDFYEVQISSFRTLTASAGPNQRIEIRSASGSPLATGIGSISYRPGFGLGLLDHTLYVVVRSATTSGLGTYTLTLTES